MPGGIAAERGKPAGQNLYIGYKRGGLRDDATIHCLPFFRASSQQSVEANFDVENFNAANALSGIEAIPVERITRDYRWATDMFATDDLEFSVFTPFGAIPEPGRGNEGQLRDALLPAVTATLTVDNRRGDATRTLVFAIDFIDAPGVHALDDEQLIGFAWRRRYGYAARADSGAIQLTQGWSIHRALQNANHVHPLGTCGGFALEVPPGAQRTLTLAMGVYLEGFVTTGLDATYFYTRHYRDLSDVLTTALDRATQLQTRARELDDQLRSSPLNENQQFLIAHATRGYYGSTQLLDVAGDPLWVVNEGEYCMLNTLDLAVDQCFWELDQSPWVVRNLLEQFSDRYSYRDQCGLSFTHDMGADNHFAPQGRSSYEMPKLTGCFSFMTQEQLCNWVLIACNYAVKTNDTHWLAQQAQLLRDCAESLRNRADDTGLMCVDSSRCEGGSEITTYDSLDESLGQARANTYIAVKCWASWLALDLMHRMIGQTLDDNLADRIAAKLIDGIDPRGTLPAVLETDNPGHRSRILPVVEALVYPAYWLRHLDDPALREPVASALDNSLIDALRKHTLTLLLDPAASNRFADGGIKLSSTSDNSWVSKIAIFQHVARAVLRLHEHEESIVELFDRADAAHARWQTAGSTYWACSDQFVQGTAKGSRYYPRIITAALWLDEQQ